VLDQLAVAEGETVLLLGGAGSVGTIAIQLAVSRGATVVAAVRPTDFPLVRSLGATPVDYSTPLADAVPPVAARVDAVFDASGRSDLRAAVAVAGGPERVVTLADPRGPQLGVALSNVVPDGVAAALDTVMTRLAAGDLTLQPQTVAPLGDAARVHARLESGELRSKVLLET
jgi:NADPH:quinone reductase-like Zn-dependent oxidoreductase